MPDPFTIQIFYPNGEPEDMRIAQKHGWTGRICFISREFWLSGADGYLAELDAPGVYILVGDDDEDDDVESDVKKVYIGHAESLAKRVGQHTQSADKSFWRYVVSVTERGSLNIAHFRWMEAYLVQLATEYDRCDLQNNVKPQKSQLAAPDVATIKTFAAQALQIFPIVEVNALKQPQRVKPPQKIKASGDGEVSSGDAYDREQVKAKGLVAFEKHKGVKLLKRTRTSFHDADKQVRVYCTFSQSHVKKDRIVFWYAAHAHHLDFLREAKEGYLLFVMAGESRAVLIPVGEFDKFTDKLSTSGEGRKEYWWVVIRKINGHFELRQTAESPNVPLDDYLLDVS